MIISVLGFLRLHRKIILCGEQLVAVWNKKTTNSPIKRLDNTWCKTDHSKQSKHFRSHLLQVFQPLHDIVNNVFEDHIVNSLTTPFLLYLAPKPVSPGEIHYYLKLFRPKKSPSLDLITAEIALQLPKKAVIHLTHILNAILNRSYHPNPKTR